MIRIGVQICSLILVVLTGACGPRSGTTMSDDMRHVVSDFQYVQAQALSQEFRPGFRPSSVKSTAPSFAAGNRYIFHRALPSDNVNLATRILPERLSKAGFRVTEYPKSYAQMKDSYVGGPLFSITFERDGYTGRFFNAGNPVIARSEAFSREWKPDDYVLEIRR